MVEKAYPSIEVSSFLNGKIAIDRLESVLNSNYTDAFPGVIFLDINMPVMNGWEFLDSIEQRGFKQRIDARIYIVSSSIDKSDFEKAKTYSNVADYLVKPLSKTDFVKYLAPEN